MQFILETPRLNLRTFVPEDIDVLAPIFADREVMHFSAKGVRSRKETQEFIHNFIQAQQTRGYSLYGAIDKATQTLIGYCGFITQAIDEREEVEIGYRLTPSFWGRGLATEAATAVRDYGFEKLGFTELISIIQPENKRSIRVAEKVGMTYERDFIFLRLPVKIYRIKK